MTNDKLAESYCNVQCIGMGLFLPIKKIPVVGGSHKIWETSELHDFVHFDALSSSRVQLESSIVNVN